MDWQSFIGNEQTISCLQRLLAGKRMPHALLFVGPAGVGKFLAAEMVAAAIFFGTETKTAELVSMPDLIILRPDGKNIKIEQVRNMQNAVAMAPRQAQWQIVIIDGAETMTVPAANSLLKTLEEPQGNKLFILTCAQQSMLLDTVISRCMLLEFRPIQPEILAKALMERQQLTATEAAVLARLSEGSLAKAETMIQQDTFEIRQRAVQLVERLPKMTMPEIWLLGNEQSDCDRDKLTELLDCIQTLLRDLLVLHYTSQQSLFYNIDLLEKLQTLQLEWSQNSILWAMQQLKKTREMLRSNVNVKMAMETLWIEMSKS